MNSIDLKHISKPEERISTASASRNFEEDMTSSSKLDSILLEGEEGITDSFFGSVSEVDEPILIQKIPSMKCALRSQMPTPHSTSPSQLLYESILSENLQEVLKILTSANKPSFEQKWQDENTYLHLAVHQGSLKICEALLDYLEDIHINARNSFMKQPLHIASEKGHLQIAQLLVRSGAEINPIDLDGNTPLHYACINNNIQLVSWLLTRGPNISILNKQSKTAEDLSSDAIRELFKRFSRKTQIAHGPSFSDNLKLEALRAKVNKSQTVTLGSFMLLQQVGKGSFGEVFLVKKIDSGQMFAMKVLSKEKIIGKNLTSYAMTERKVLSRIKHPFMVSLHYAFQTSESLFLILDYCPGGDLSRHLMVEKRFGEARARVYLCEIVLALEELHKGDIIFRDLKPDNIVLDHEGHAILTDFGLSKEGINSEIQAKSFCGSVAYLAPEVLNRSGHGKAVDWYLLGVLFYEMLVGVPPYFTTNKSDLINNISTGKLKIPTFLSIEAKELLKDLLQRDPSKRLGAIRDAEEIKQHRFFRGIDWEIVEKRGLKTHKIQIPPVNNDGPNVEAVFGRGQGSEGLKINGWSFVCN